ncbi:MAG: tRNA N6-adenosine threonylcarbamoyltransferase [Phycisphaerae bacterium]|nr:MAG: tRNA N6-adenosine threonylcarbamoyltransferase [Phycisphaerae bacterium]
MIVLGIETSCDETAAAVVLDGRRVMSSVVASQTDLHEKYAGVVPELASRAHAERVLPLVREALAQAGVGLGMLDAVAVGNRPGLIGSLLVGVSAASALAWSLGKPLVGIDHVRAHLYAGVLHEDGESPGPDAAFPALGLVVSGGHTSLYEVTNWRTMRRLGATIDDAMGEAFDKAATILGLPYPGGPNLDRLAGEPGANDTAVELPVSRLGKDSLDFSFSGLKTALLYAVQGVPGERAPTPPGPLTPERRRDLAASFQWAACAAAVLKLERALDAASARGTLYRTILTGGGVTSNSRLRRELLALGSRRAVPVLLPRLAWCVDNAAMIAGLGSVRLAAGEADGLGLSAQPTTA